MTHAEKQDKRSAARFDTIAVHGDYTHEAALANQGSLIEPAYLTTAQHFSDSERLAAALAYEESAWGYSRISNPTVSELETRLARLETYGSDLTASTCATASGMAAIFLATNPLLTGSGQKNFVASAHCYGGTFMLFSERYAAERGIEVRWVRNPLDLEEWQRSIDAQTRFLFAEMPSNPLLEVVDIPALADVAHARSVPLIVDATIATPALLRPLTLGADIVIQSLTKTIGASGLAVGGALTAKQNIPSNFLSDPYRANYATQVKLLPARDFGPALSPLSALFLLNDLRTLRSRINVLSQRTERIVDVLVGHAAVESVRYPGVASHPGHDIAKRDMQLVDSATATTPSSNRYGHLVSFTLHHEQDAARRVLDRFRLIYRATDLGRIKSVATIPSISTHQQQGEGGRELAAIPDNLIRLSVGGEHPDDLIDDLVQALSAA